MRNKIEPLPKTKQMEAGGLFFTSRAKDFNVEEGEFHPFSKRSWRGKCNRAVNTERYRRYVSMLLEITGFRQGIKILDVGCGVGAEILDVGNSTVTIEETGDSNKINALMELLKPFGIKEVVRTGKIAIQTEEEKKSRAA